VEKQTLNQKLKKIKMLALDMDGVLTNRQIIYDSEGRELKFFDAYDGAGIAMIQECGIKVSIISGRHSNCTEIRGKNLNISEIHQGNTKKTDVIETILKKHNLKLDEVAYIGDDLFDIPLIKKVGLGITVADAVKEVKKHAFYVCKNPGGKGAVREVTDMLLKAQGLWKIYVDKWEI